jgi:hypothetical protein
MCVLRLRMKPLCVRPLAKCIVIVQLYGIHTNIQLVDTVDIIIIDVIAILFINKQISSISISLFHFLDNQGSSCQTRRMSGDWVSRRAKGLPRGFEVIYDIA